MHIQNRQIASSWFRSGSGRRYGKEMALLVAAKLIALTILYFVFIAPQPRADTSSAATRQHLLGTSAPNQPASP